MEHVEGRGLVHEQNAQILKWVQCEPKLCPWLQFRSV